MVLSLFLQNTDYQIINIPTSLIGLVDVTTNKVTINMFFFYEILYSPMDLAKKIDCLLTNRTVSNYEYSSSDDVMIDVEVSSVSSPANDL